MQGSAAAFDAAIRVRGGEWRILFRATALESQGIFGRG